MADNDKIYSELTGISHSLGNIEGNILNIKDDLKELKVDLKIVDKRLDSQELRISKVYWIFGFISTLMGGIFAILKWAV